MPNSANHEKKPIRLRVVLLGVVGVAATVVWSISQAAATSASAAAAPHAAPDARAPFVFRPPDAMGAGRRGPAAAPSGFEAEDPLIAADVCLFDGVVLRGIGDRYVADAAGDGGSVSPWWPALSSDEPEADADGGIDPTDPAIEELQDDLDTAGYAALLDDCHAGADLLAAQGGFEPLNARVRTSLAISDDLALALEHARAEAASMGPIDARGRRSTYEKVSALVRQSREALQAVLQATRAEWEALPKLRDDEQAVLDGDSRKRRLFYGIVDARPLTTTEREGAIDEWRRALSAADRVLQRRLDAPDGGLVTTMLAPLLETLGDPQWSSRELSPDLLLLLAMSYRTTLLVRAQLEDVILEMRATPLRVTPPVSPPRPSERSDHTPGKAANTARGRK